MTRICDDRKGSSRKSGITFFYQQDAGRAAACQTEAFRDAPETAPACQTGAALMMFCEIQAVETETLERVDIRRHAKHISDARQSASGK